MPSDERAGTLDKLNLAVYARQVGTHYYFLDGKRKDVHGNHLWTTNESPSRKVKGLRGISVGEAASSPARPSVTESEKAIGSRGEKVTGSDEVTGSGKKKNPADSGGKNGGKSKAVASEEEDGSEDEADVSFVKTSSTVSIELNKSYEFKSHLIGTTYHRVNFSANLFKTDNWKQFWQLHSNSPFPLYCPGLTSLSSSNKSEAHLIGKPGVGAHVRIRDAAGNVCFAIIPSCSACNTNRVDLSFECMAVTIENPNTRNFVGKIYLKNNRHWKKVDNTSTIKKDGVQFTTITGTDSSDKSATEEYRDPDDYINLLCTYQKGLLTKEEKSLKNDKDFKPQIYKCNARAFPTNVTNKGKYCKLVGDEEVANLNNDFAKARLKG